jgi:hypothetical protein
MNALNLTDGDITLRKEIVQLLKAVVSQNWSFSFLTTAKSRVVTHPLKLLSVNAQEGTFCVGLDPVISKMNLSDSVMFRAQSGGVSIMFQSLLIEPPEGKSSAGKSSLHFFDLPYKVACTQLRKTIRVNLESLAEVPVTLYLVNGALVEGTIMDISTSGAKFRVNQDLGQELRDPQVLDACKINLPNDLVLQTGAQLIGMVNDEENDVSFLRCQFVHMRTQDEEVLDNFISTMLRQLESEDTA